jgi:hypothetical protein
VSAEIALQIYCIRPAFDHFHHPEGGQRVVCPFPAFEEEIVILVGITGQIGFDGIENFLVDDQDVFFAGLFLLESDSVSDSLIAYIFDAELEKVLHPHSRIDAHNEQESVPWIFSQQLLDRPNVFKFGDWIYFHDFTSKVCFSLLTYKMLLSF